MTKPEEEAIKWANLCFSIIGVAIVSATFGWRWVGAAMIADVVASGWIKDWHRWARHYRATATTDREDA